MAKTAKTPVAGKTAAGRNKNTGKSSASSGRAAKPAKRTSPAKNAPKQTKAVKKPVQQTSKANEKQSLIKRFISTLKKIIEKKNVSKKIPNGQLIITNDLYFYNTDGKSDKTRMATVVDSNEKDELAIVKYTKSKKHGREFPNDKGFIAYGDKIYTLDDEENPIKIDNKKFSKGSERRNISKEQAHEIKVKNLSEGQFKKWNRANIRNLKNAAKKEK